MHEMLTILTNVRGVCLSVSLSVTRLISASLCKNGWTDQDDVWGELFFLGGGARDIVLDVGLDLFTERGKWPTSKFKNPFYLRNG